MSVSGRLIASIQAYEATYNSDSRACQLLRDALAELDRLRAQAADARVIIERVANSDLLARTMTQKLAQDYLARHKEGK